MKDSPHTASHETSDSPLQPYEPPRIRLIDEEEVLSSFQVAQASLSWWYM